jgi:predicted RNase H-like HicB family nuclease
MKYPVIITKQGHKDICATVLGLPDCSVRAETRDEALKQIQIQITRLMRQIEIVEIDVPVQPMPDEATDKTPWEFFGTFRNDPAWSELFDTIEHARNMED